VVDLQLVGRIIIDFLSFHAAIACRHQLHERRAAAVGARDKYVIAADNRRGNGVVLAIGLGLAIHPQLFSRLGIYSAQSPSIIFYILFHAGSIRNNRRGIAYFQSSSVVLMQLELAAPQLLAGLPVEGDDSGLIAAGAANQLLAVDQRRFGTTR